MSLRAIIHLVLHVAVPGLVAWLFFRHPQRSPAMQAGTPKKSVPPVRMHHLGMLRLSTLQHAWLLLLLGWAIDLDHLLADPIYAPDRCSIGFHPLHTAPAIFVYGAMVIPMPTRLLGIGLLIHIGLDLIDCLWMRHSG